MLGGGEVGGRDGPSTGGAVGMDTRFALGRCDEESSKKMNSSSSRRNIPLLLDSGEGGSWVEERRRREPLWEKWIVPMVVDGSRLSGTSEVLVMVAIGPQRVSRKVVENADVVDW